MKKIMFNDRYGLTQAVIDGRKTQTRRIISGIKSVRQSPFVPSGLENEHGYELKSKYKVGEIVAVAQSYKDAGLPTDMLQTAYRPALGGWIDLPLTRHYGWTNKMFVIADLMPHQIRITNVRVERLNEISIEDCVAEGIYFDEDPMNPQCLIWTFPNAPQWYFNPREAYAALIDKISGEGTWKSNPFVWVYEFEILKQVKI